MLAPKNILCLASWYPHQNDIQEGIFIQQQLDEISKIGKVTLVTLRTGNKFKLSLSDERGFKHYQYTYAPHQYWSKHLSWLISWNKIIREFPDFKFDLIHLHVVFPLGLIALKFQKKYQIPLVVSEHWTGYNDPKKPLGKIRKQFVQYLLKKASLIIVVSNYLKKNLLELSPKSHFEVIPNIVDFTEQSKVLKKNPNVVTALNVSDHIDDHKNISGLLKAIKPVLDKNTNLKLVLVGEGEDTPMLKSLSKTLGIHNQVVFKGRLQHKEVLKKIQQADFGIINSRFETFSIVAFEFLAAQKPIIITDCGGPTEYLPREFGIKIPIDQTKDLTQAILKMLSTYTQYKLEDTALEVRKQFSRESFRNRIEEAYRQVLNAQ